jgi:hypothetical protein
MRDAKHAGRYMEGTGKKIRLFTLYSDQHQPILLMEFADWLGVLAKPVVAERFFYKIRTVHIDPTLETIKK